MDVLTIDDDVAQIDPYAEYDPLILRGRDVALGHPTLHRNRTGYGLNHAWEFNKKAITRRFDDPTFVLGDLGINEFAAMDTKPGERDGFILPHEAAVSG